MIHIQFNVFSILLSLIFNISYYISTIIIIIQLSNYHYLIFNISYPLRKFNIIIIQWSNFQY